LAAAPWPPAINAKLSIQIHKTMRKTGKSPWPNRADDDNGGNKANGN